MNCCPSNLSGSAPPPPPLCVNKYTEYTYTVCKGGVWGSGIKTDKHLPQSPFTVHINFLKWQHFALPSMSLLFPRSPLYRMGEMGWLKASADLARLLGSGWWLRMVKSVQMLRYSMFPQLDLTVAIAAEQHLPGQPVWHAALATAIAVYSHLSYWARRRSGPIF